MKKLEPPRTSWNRMEQAKALWNKVQPTVPRWNQQQTDSKKQKIHQKETVIAIRFPKKIQNQQQLLSKGTQSQIFTGGTAWNMIEPVTNWHKSSDTHEAKLCVQTVSLVYRTQLQKYLQSLRAPSQMLAKCPRSGSALYIVTITFIENKARAKLLR